MSRFEFCGLRAEKLVISLVPMLKFPVAVTLPSLRNKFVANTPESLITFPVVESKVHISLLTALTGPVTKSFPTLPFIVVIQQV